MAYIIGVAHLPLTSILGAGGGGFDTDHGGNDTIDGVGITDWGGGGNGINIDNKSLPQAGINLDNAAYPPSAGWIPIKTSGMPNLSEYSDDPAKEALMGSWRTIRYAANTQTGYQPPLGFQPRVHAESTPKPVSGGGKKDVGFRQIGVSRAKVSEVR